MDLWALQSKVLISARHCVILGCNVEDWKGKREANGGGFRISPEAFPMHQVAITKEAFGIPKKPSITECCKSPGKLLDNQQHCFPSWG